MKSKIILLLVVGVIIGMVLCGCEKSSTSGNDSDKETEKVNKILNKASYDNYTIEQLINKIDKDIKFGMNKEDIIKAMGKKPDLDIDKESKEYKGIAYCILLDNKKGNVAYFINNNNNLSMISFTILKEKTYSDYYKDYIAIYDSLVKIYGNPTENNDNILNPSAKECGYEVYKGNSTYSRTWDLDEVVITSFLNNIDKTEKLTLQVVYESKKYIKD